GDRVHGGAVHRGGGRGGGQLRRRRDQRADAEDAARRAPRQALVPRGQPLRDEQHVPRPHRRGRRLHDDRGPRHARRRDAAQLLVTVTAPRLQPRRAIWFAAAAAALLLAPFVLTPYPLALLTL